MNKLILIINKNKINQNQPKLIKYTSKNKIKQAN